MGSISRILTREKHLDHMVRVVPIIVIAYAVQCYFIMNMSPGAFAVNGLFFLGACLALMIGAFITYDLTHRVIFNEESFTVSVQWLRYEQTVKYDQLKSIHVSEEAQSFSTLKFTAVNGMKFHFFFVDEADKIKTWVETKAQLEINKAA